MEFWPEFLASSWGKEFVAGGFGGMAGVISGHPLDTLRIRMQQPPPAGVGAAGKAQSATGLLRSIVKSEGPSALYRGMTAPLASVTFQNAVAFQVYALLSRAFDSTGTDDEPPSYKSVALGGFGTGALQSLMLTPVELLKIQLQLQTQNRFQPHDSVHHRGGGAGAGPMALARRIFQREGIRGLYRGLSITVLRDAPAHGVYFWTYEYTREQIHPGCRRSGQESLGTMLVSGGLAGVASWVCCYPLDVIKSRLQGQAPHHDNRGGGTVTVAQRYSGIVDCFRKSVAEEGYSVLWRGLGTAVTRAFVVNGAIFAAYEVALRCMANGSSGLRLTMDEA